MKPILIITLNPAIDKTVIVDRFFTGKDNRVKKVVNTAGGKGINVGRALNVLGMPSLCSGFLGGPNGEFIVKELDKERISHDFSKIASNTRINITAFDKSCDKTTRIIEPAPIITKTEINDFFRKYESLVRKSSCVIISGSGLGYADLSPRLTDIAGRYSIPVALDTSGRELRAGFYSRPFLLKINLSEARELSGKKLSSILEIKKWARYVFSKGIKVCAVTLGEKGAVLFDGNDMICVKPVEVNAKTTVGCGDAFLAGLIFALLKDEKFSDCARLAAACGASAAKSMVPGKINILTIINTLTS